MSGRKIILAAVLIAGGHIAMASAPALAERGEGGGERTSGGGGGAPLPALGVTLFGQVLGAGGLFALWRRRRARATEQLREQRPAEQMAVPEAPGQA